MRDDDRRSTPAPQTAGDALSRLWQDADPSRGRHLEAIAELRERKRREQQATPGARRRQRAVRAADAAAATGSRSAAPAPADLDCERCGRTVGRALAERVAIPSVLHGPVEHILCPRCAGEVRRGLLPQLTGEAAPAAPPPPPAPAVGEARRAEEAEAPAVSLPSRAGWFLLRLGLYALIAIAAFAVVSWLTTR